MYVLWGCEHQTKNNIRLAYISDNKFSEFGSRISNPQNFQDLLVFGQNSLVSYRSYSYHLKYF